MSNLMAVMPVVGYERCVSSLLCDAVASDEGHKGEQKRGPLRLRAGMHGFLGQVGKLRWLATS